MQRDRGTLVSLVLLLLKSDFWLSEQVHKLKFVWTVNMGAIGIAEVGLAGIAKSLVSETLGHRNL